MPSFLILEGDTDKILYQSEVGEFIFSTPKGNVENKVKMQAGNPYYIKDKTGTYYQISLRYEHGHPTLYRRHVEDNQWIHESTINLNSSDSSHWRDTRQIYGSNFDASKRFPQDQYEADPVKWQARILEKDANQEKTTIEIFRDATDLLIYDTVEKKLYRKTKAQSNSDFLSNAQEIEFPVVFPALSINSRCYQMHLSDNPPHFDDCHGVRRYFDEGDNTWHYESFIESKWEEISPLSQDVADSMYFPWEVEKQYPTSISAPTAEGNKLDKLQGDAVDALLEPLASTLKESCVTKEQYHVCLTYLIEEQSNIPADLTEQTKKALGQIKNYLTETGLHGTKINSSIYFQGHFATIGETKKYALLWLKKVLNQIDPAYDYKVPDYNTARWSILASPELAGRERNFAEEAEVKATLELIHKVQESGKTEVKEDATLQDLERMAEKLEKLLDPKLKDGMPFVERLTPFLKILAHHVTERIETFGRIPGVPPNVPFGIQENFLLPLYIETKERIAREQSINLPNTRQFKPLRVDKWNDVSRLATHTDFVNEQFKNPRAVFVIPDNFEDAKLPPDKLHMRQGRAGLAGPMAPIKMTQNPDGSPVYDLCTFGIPTGGKFSGNAEAAEQEIKKYFARLYEQVKFGRTIVVPYAKQGGELAPAFGTGTFAHSDLTAKLGPFIFAEFEKLKNFCNGTLRLDQLDEEYRKAWEQAAMQAVLPLPQITMPVEPAEPAAILGKDLLNPGFRTNFKEWFAARDLGELAEHIDEKSQMRTLTGTLPSGAQITVYNDKIMLNGAGKMTPDEFENNMRNLINAYKAGWAPGEPPPTQALGTPAQKAVISRLLREAKIELAPEPTAPTTSDMPESPPRSNDPPEGSTSPLRQR